MGGTGRLAALVWTLRLRSGQAAEAALPTRAHSRCLTAAFQQKVGEGEHSEEDESADLVYARGEKSVEDGGRSKDEAEHRSRYDSAHDGSPGPCARQGRRGACQLPEPRG